MTDVETSTAVVFRVLGVPAPQGSKTVFNGHAVEGSSPTGRAKHKAWRQAVSSDAHDAWEGRPPLDGPISLSIRFVLPRPKGAPKRNRWQASRPDLDKLIRATCDGLRDAGVYTDDSRVSVVTASKVLAELEYPWTGATITIHPLAHEEVPR